MGRSELRPIVDLALGGKLETFLRERAEAGESNYSVALRLRDDHNIEVSPETVRTWFIHYGIEKTRAAS